MHVRDFYIRMSNPKVLKKYIGYNKYVNIFSLAVSDIKLWLEEDDDVNTDQSLHPIQNHSIKGSKLIQNNFYPLLYISHSKAENCFIFVFSS